MKTIRLDVAMNEVEKILPEVNTVNYLRGLKGDDSVLITLETIMAGVMKPSGNAIDLDSITETGMYGINKDGLTNNPPVNFGILLVFFSGNNSAGGGSPVVQIAIDERGSTIKIRVRWLGTWHTWKSISIT